MLARKSRRGTADFIHRGSGVGSFNRVRLPGHPSVLDRPNGRFRKSVHRRNALWCCAKAPERILWACAVALAPRGPVGLGGGSMRPNAYGASGSDNETGNFRRGTARKRHWLMPRISFLPSRSVSDRRGHVAMRKFPLAHGPRHFWRELCSVVNDHASGFTIRAQSGSGRLVPCLSRTTIRLVIDKRGQNSPCENFPRARGPR